MSLPGMRTSLPTVPLERALSKMGVASRAQARAWIEAGEIAIDSVVVRDPLYSVVPERQRITHLGSGVTRARTRVILLYKPRGVVTTRSDEKGRATVFSLINENLAGFHAVGRLDMQTTGLLLLTNDTRLSSRLTDPAIAVPRVYVATVRGRITDEKAALIREGITDAGEMLRADAVVVRKTSGRESHLTVTLSEGKNREIRRIFAALGHEVTRLKRVVYGTLTLGRLQPGEYRELSEDEVREAFRAVEGNIKS